MDGVLKVMAAQKLTLSYLQSNGFTVPILIKDMHGLGMKVPPDNYDVTSICELLGKDFLVDVVDATQQSEFQIKIQDFSSYFCSKHRKCSVCIPSLDFSNTRLEDFVESPSIARDLDWVERYWPKELSSIKPCLQKYCSVSTKDSYVDFCITSGGSSLWHHIFEGEKIFYLIEPTEINLRAFQTWISFLNKKETFFADQVDVCYQLVLKKGETIFIPTGWIYACLTLSDCIAFGGNFLHELNLYFQLRIHDVERTITKGKSSFPMFELVNIYAGFHFVEELQKYNHTKSEIPENKLYAIKALAERIKFWIHAKEHKIFKQISKQDCQKLVKDLSKQVKQAERLHKTLKMAKPDIEKVTNSSLVKDVTGSLLKEDDKTKRLTMTLKKMPPPVKLTLPKPSTYPYRNNKLAQDGYGETNKSPEDNVRLIDHPWSIADASHSNGDLKIKLRIGRQSPDVLKISNTSHSTGDPSFHERLQPIDNSNGEKNKTVENVQDCSSQLCDQNQASKLISALSGTRTIPCDNASSCSDGSSSDLEVVFVGKNIHHKPKKKNLGITLSDTLGNYYNEGDFTSSDVNPLVPHTSGDAAVEITCLSTGIISSLSDTPSNTGVSSTFEPSTTLSEILSSGTSEEIGIHSSLKTAAVSHSWKTAFQDRRITGLAQIDYSLTDEPKPTTSRTTGSLKSTISLSSESEGKLSVCSRTRPNRKKKVALHRQNKKNVTLVEDGHSEMGRVHEDDSFVYLSLETSDEEEEPTRKFRGKQHIDETWCPGARLGPLLPRVEKPVREVKRNQAIEKGLEAAAAKKAGLPPPKRPYHIRKKRVSRPVPAPCPLDTLDAGATLTVTTTSPVIPSKRKAKKITKPKRGMATAKQRLGKILKMNKMTF
ncbi:lysine-specific demethylase PHF2-like [Bacillus rossius redtenbacheri]|uniref:lysine-specific demethylase PHF2-like n=1 Tax=Bacillus rossius redtenbacheri TaxID=93214 RepID=UPI002FDED02E